jgi:hypothetical protein
MTKVICAVLGFSVIIALTFVLLAQEQPKEQPKEPPKEQPKEEAKPKYLGMSKCKTCHQGEKRGDQYKIWALSDHSKAYPDLATDKSKELAKKQGIEDPQKSEKCLKCHTTGYGEPKEQFAESFKIEEGVSCEACHGAASEYLSLHSKKDKKEEAKKKGLIADPGEEFCKKCHNPESPTYKEFKFDEAKKKIEHPMPKEEKAPEEPKK